MTSRTDPVPPLRLVVTSVALAAATVCASAGATARPQISNAGTSFTSSPMKADLGELELVTSGEISEGAAALSLQPPYTSPIPNFAGDLVQAGSALSGHQSK